MFYLATTDYSQKDGFSDSSKELFKSYKEGKNIIRRATVCKIIWCKKNQKISKDDCI